nr:PREDICTED: GH3 domain-containing protein isoform X2 [Latimeria chalumnae]|eukprot:XP_014345657.1 PREDICTED: GH3 domain-containing protein isoform X2 [Latimeria chalumnae]
MLVTWLFAALAAAVLGLGAAMLLWKSTGLGLKGPRRSLASLLNQYLMLRVAGWIGSRQRQRLEMDTQDVSKVQQELLLQRLQQNQDTEYGKLYKFREIKDPKAFCRLHPLTQYSHYSDYIKRISQGEEKVLIADRPVTLAMTSGTSGSSAMLLSTKGTARDIFFQGVTVCLNAMAIAYPQTQNLQKTAKFFYTPNWRTSESGIPVGPNSSTPTSAKRILALYSTPAPAFDVMTEPEALYLHLLFALRDRTLGMLEANFASVLYYAFAALRNRWEELTEDIRLGRVNPELTIPEKVRERLAALLKPDARRASELQAEFEKGFGGIAKRLWPELHLVLTVDSGSNELYGDVLKDFYCKGVPLYSPFYVATEGLIGVNLWPDTTERHYLLCPRSMFCEFIPLGLSEEEQPRTLLMEEVKENELYELVVTNNAGLYRYRIGDVVKVVRFYNQCPVVEFKYRQGEMLNVRGEKISEEGFYRALQRAVRLWPGAELIDYSCAESSLLGPFSGSSDPHCEVFVELKGVRDLSEEKRYKLHHRCCCSSSADDITGRRVAFQAFPVPLTTAGNNDSSYRSLFHRSVFGYGVYTLRINSLVHARQAPLCV